MRQRPRLLTALTVLLVVLIFAMIALVDISGWPPRTRIYLVRKAPPLPMARPRPPLHPPAGPARPAPAPPAPAVAMCTPDRIAAGVPSVDEPPLQPVRFREAAVGPGRGYLEGEDPTPSPDGREVAFAKEGENGRSHIWISSVDGKTLRRLTSDVAPDQHRALDEREPAWSPDGRRIAFTSEGSLWLINLDGTGLRKLPAITGYVEHTSPAWSPDGRRLALVARREDRSRDIWIVDVNGSDPRRLTDLTGREADPAFSPDGRQVVFASTSETGPVRTGRQHLMLMNIDGSGLCRLSNDAANDSKPAWSARGIVFQRECCRLWWIPADRPTSLYPLLQDEQGASPAWVRNGASVVYESGDRQLLTYDLETRTITPLTQLNTLDVTVYVKPGLKNTIHPRTDGPIPVAILSASWFDPVGRLDRGSIRFGPQKAGRPPMSCAVREINDDGVPDLVCEFDVAGAFSEAHTEGVLTAVSKDGLLYEGRDAVQVVY